MSLTGTDSTDITDIITSSNVNPPLWDTKDETMLKYIDD